jgi:hypothetical protein
MQKIQNIGRKLLNHKVLSILTVVAIVLIVATTVYAVTYTLNQQVGVTIKVNPVPAGGGGGGGYVPPPDQTEYAYIYHKKSDGTYDILGSLNFEYLEDQTATYTGYVKSSEITTISAPELVMDDGVTGFTLVAILGTETGEYKTVTITAAGGTANDAAYTGTVTFTGS